MGAINFRGHYTALVLGACQRKSGGLRHRYGADGGGARRFVACSNEYASSISLGSLHAMPVKPTPNGCGWALNPAGNGGSGAFGTIANGTITVG